MFEAGAGLETRKTLENLGSLNLEEKKLNMSPDEARRGAKGDKGQGEHLTSAKRNSPTKGSSKADGI